jgi:hypothetical protein
MNFFFGAAIFERKIRDRLMHNSKVTAGKILKSNPGDNLLLMESRATKSVQVGNGD